MNWWIDVVGNRCLEEGAEEFFLKPVRLSDLSRLRPHIMKTKSKDQNQGKEENEEKQEESSESLEASQEQDQQVVDQQQQQQQPPPVPANSNKRKAMEEGLSPDRTRPRYNGITTVVWLIDHGTNFSFDLNNVIILLPFFFFFPFHCWLMLAEMSVERFFHVYNLHGNSSFQFCFAT